MELENVSPVSGIISEREMRLKKGKKLNALIQLLNITYAKRGENISAFARKFSKFG